MGLFICFTLPGILIGMLLMAGVKAKKCRPNVAQAKHGRHKEKGSLYIYDLQKDYMAATSNCA